MKELILSITKKDFRIDTFKASGKGGQHRNETSSAVRITHIQSGAVGECSNHREQGRNKAEAFRRLVSSDKFKKWHQLECAKRMGLKAIIEEKVREWTQDKYLKIEHYDPSKESK